MPTVSPSLPAESDLLCERCGYTLNGLPPDGNCPECGQPVRASAFPDRAPPAWESGHHFWATTAAVIFRPTRFFRQSTSRGDGAASARFGARNIAIASGLFALAASIHAQWLVDYNSGSPMAPAAQLLVFAVLWSLIFFALIYLTRLAARLTNWEASYRGLRLSVPVVRRALDYHAAHYLPVALIALATVITFRVLQVRHLSFGYEHVNAYLYTLSGEVVVGAGYLFQTYWIGMRNLMYANR